MWERHNGACEPLFCSAECEDQFWATREMHRQVLDDLIQARREAPEFWSQQSAAWEEQYNLAWWHLARYMGVRGHATDPDRARWHEHYYAVGQMISRAGEWESQAETTLALLLGEPPEKYRRCGADNVVKKLRANAHRWPHIESRVNELCDAAVPALDQRNWLVHSWVTPSWSGEVVDLRKPIKRQAHAGQRTASVEQTQRLAARFVWLIEATSRVVAHMHANERGPVTEPLGPPPPIDYELTDEQVHEAFRAKRMRQRLDEMTGDHAAETWLALAELRVAAHSLLADGHGQSEDHSKFLDRFATKASDQGPPGLVAAAVLCASTCELLAEVADAPPMDVAEGLAFASPNPDGMPDARSVVQAFLLNKPRIGRHMLDAPLRDGAGRLLARQFAEAITQCLEKSGKLTCRQPHTMGEDFFRDFFDGLGA